MRRAKEREMDANQCVGVVPTRFYNKVMEIPIVQFGVQHATQFYGKVKDFNPITHKSFVLAETVTGVVVGRVTPLAQRGICLTSPLPQKIDDIAYNGLEKLEQNVKYITKTPDVIVSEVKTTVEEALTAVKVRVTGAAEGVLISKPVQTYFDLLEFMLTKVQRTMDIVLPEESKEGANGAVETAPPERVDRGWWLLGQFVGILGTTKNRVMKRVWTRIDNTSHAADAVFNEAKKAVNHALPVAADKDAAPTPTNGDSVPANKSKKNKNKPSDN